MATSTDDFYHQKTDAELQFFADHPELYQPSLVEAARGELHRRGVVPVRAAPRELPPLTYVSPEPAAPSGLRTGPLTLGLVAVLLLGLGGFYIVKHQTPPPPPVAPAEPKAPPQLVEVETSAIPTYDGVVEQAVAQQVKRLPAAELAAAKATPNGEALHQYRELAKRFWAAECQTEYLTSQAYAGKAGALFADQALVARSTWSTWNKAAMYTYKHLGPTMQNDFQRMQEIASSQQHILERLPDLLPQQAFLNDKELNARGAEVQDWLRKLRPASPVTGKPYEATVIKMQM